MSEGLKVEGLRKAIGKFSLEASFEIGPGDRAGLVGKSGIGKTSLLRLIAGLDQPEEGRLWLAGMEITRLPVQKREIGFVFQEQALFGGRSVFENVAFGLKMRKTKPAEVVDQVTRWLGKLGLSGRASETVDHLSGGERQRVAFARALIIRPKLIIMDEPFTGLDAGLRTALCEELLTLHAENPVPLLFVSHDEQDLNQLATRKITFREEGSLRRAQVL